MKILSKTKFHIKSLNQEKILTEIASKTDLFDVERTNVNELKFCCSYFSHKVVKKILDEKNIEILSMKHEGIYPQIFHLLTSYGTIVAIFLFALFFVVQNQFVFQYQISGTEKISSSEVVCFLKENFSKNKNKIDTKQVELELLENFSRISYASCIIKGQTLVVNIKEKLLPEQLEGNFSPIISSKNAKITKINLISGTVKVKVGQVVKKGDVLVEPYTIDTSGKVMSVEAKAEIFADVYNEASVDHYERFVEVRRTGKVAQRNDVLLFGLSIYNFSDEMNFQMYETEVEEIDLIKDMFCLLNFEKQNILKQKKSPQSAILKT